MYERVHTIAIELGILDIEVGSLAGSGLAALALGYIDQALLARRRATERSTGRSTGPSYVNWQLRLELKL